MLSAIQRARLDSLRRTQKRITLGWGLLTVITLFHVLRATAFYYDGPWQYGAAETGLVIAYGLNCVLFRQGYSGYFAVGMVSAGLLPLVPLASPPLALGLAAGVVLVQLGLVYRSYHPAAPLALEV